MAIVRVGSGASLYAGSHPKRALVLPRPARRAGDRALRASYGAVAPERRRRHDIPHAEGRRRRRVQGRPLSARRADRRGGRLVGRRRLPEVRPHDDLHRRRPAHGRPRLPGQMGARAGPADFDAEAQFGARWLLRMWDDRTRTLYYQVGIGNGNDSIVSDHDIWRLPQDDDTYGGTIRRTGTSATGRSSARARRARRSAPTSPGGTPRRWRSATRSIARPTRASRGNCLVVGRAHLRPRGHHADGHLTTAIPFDFYPESEWRDDMELGAAELALALEQPGAPRGVPHRDSRHLCGAGRALGARLHPRAQRRRRHAEPLRRERASAMPS